MEKSATKPDISVAVFDSGIGGLNLLKQCYELMPDVNYYYLADNFNVPYGSKSKDEILRLVKSKFLLVSDINLSAAVIACNTATSNCIEELRKEFPFPIIGIQPAIKPAAEYGGRCLVLATPATVNSRSFKELICRYEKDGKTQFYVHPCEGLAEYIENNLLNLSGGIPEGMLPDIDVDSVVLGCTHYAYIKDFIQATYNCAIFDGIAGTAARLAYTLGIVDHQGVGSGIFDHSPDKSPKITFLGGNFAKNAQIFASLQNIK